MVLTSDGCLLAVEKLPLWAAATDASRFHDAHVLAEESILHEICEELETSTAYDILESVEQ